VQDKEAGGRGYKHIRRLRRDGNCFYRAFLFQLFEHYALALAEAKNGDVQQYKKNYNSLVEKVEASKKDMCDNAGYDEIVIEDFYDVFIATLKKLADLNDEFIA